MRYLIFNGDDLGLSPGVNRGIVECHEQGVVTSASLLVDTPWSSEAAARCRSLPNLSVGLHAHIRHSLSGTVRESRSQCRRQLLAQLRRFESLMGTGPTHIDSHHNDHFTPERREVFAELADQCGVPLRGSSFIGTVASYYGNWDGQDHLEQVTLEGLARVLSTEAVHPVNEISCHPGRVDRHLRSTYRRPRQVELRTLCDPRAASLIADLGFELVNFTEAVSFGTANGKRARREVQDRR